MVTANKKPNISNAIKWSMLLLWSYMALSTSNNALDNWFLKGNILCILFHCLKIVAEERKSVLSEKLSFIASFPSLSSKKSPLVLKKKIVRYKNPYKLFCIFSHLLLLLPPVNSSPWSLCITASLRTSQAFLHKAFIIYAIPVGK